MSTDDEDNGGGFLLPESAEDATPTSEPKLTQLDEESREIIKNAIYKYSFLRDRDTGGLIKQIEEIRYPDLELAMSYAASHLNSVMYYRWPQAEAAIMFWEGLFYDPLNLYYDDDPKALRILDALDQVLRRAIRGGSIDGTHQRYNVRMAGAHRTFEVVKTDGSK